MLILWSVSLYKGQHEVQSSPQALTVSPQAETQPRTAQPQSQAVHAPLVVRKLYVDSPDMEPLIAANIRIEAANYGFELVDQRSEADYVLVGTAGVYKEGGFLGACVPFYDFNVLRKHAKHKDAGLKLALGFPNDFPCVRLQVAFVWRTPIV